MPHLISNQQQSLHKQSLSPADMSCLAYWGLMGLDTQPKAAVCHLALEPNQTPWVKLPTGCPFYAGDAVLEAQSPVEVRSNPLVGVYACSKAGMVDKTPFCSMEGLFASVFDKGENQALYLGFANGFHEQIRLYLEIENACRPPFPMDFALTTLHWDAFDGSQWQSLSVLEDETCGLLQRGYVLLECGFTMEPWEQSPLPKAYYIRCTLAQGAYDIPPRMGRIFTSSVQVRQAHTHAQMLEYTYCGGSIALDWYFQEDAVLSVWVQEAQGFVEWFGGESAPLCRVQAGTYPWERVVEFDQDAFGTVPKIGSVILITTAEPSMVKACRLGITDGCANQTFSVDMDGVLDLEIGLAAYHPSGRRLLLPCTRISHLDEAGYDDLVYTYSPITKTLTFGNGIHGVQPAQGLEVLATRLATSLLNTVQLSAGTTISLPQPLEGTVEAYTIEDAQQGVSAPTLDVLKMQIPDKLNKITRAVTPADYKSLVLQTAGLLIHSVAVIPPEEYAKAAHVQLPANTVVIAVKPYAHQRLPQLSPFYQAHIRQYLEPYRLLTTNVEVVPAAYVGVVVTGKIFLKHKGEIYQQQVCSKIKDAVDAVHKGTFGAWVYYGQLYCTLEALDCVQQVDALWLDALGSGGMKTAQGDILVYPHGISYLHDCAIEFL